MVKFLISSSRTLMDFEVSLAVAAGVDSIMSTAGMVIEFQMSGGLYWVVPVA